jgi:hypothetical protein
MFCNQCIFLDQQPESLSSSEAYNDSMPRKLFKDSQPAMGDRLLGQHQKSPEKSRMAIR